MVSESAGSHAVQHMFHDMKQPLNIIRLAIDNVRTRIIPLLGEEDASYLALKLERIERQIERSVEMIDTAAVGRPTP